MAAQPATVILDNEAVAALSDIRHPKHRALLPYLEGIAQRRARDTSLRVLVPVAVRVEAGWDRTRPKAAVVNRVSGARDVPLTGDAADTAQQLRGATGVSVVDATVGEAADAAAKPVVILTSDADDMRALAERIDGEVRVQRV
ncbi:MAG: hypothetical protein GEV00_10185 [Actinophytocola sp.]|nr:hypothetical protein [Actinophytocola sp.]